MNHKILSIKRNSAIFLALVLVTGTIAAFAPSFMVGAAQAEPHYGMEREYGSYEQQTEYPSYQPDYKPEYPSDDSYKSKKDSNSIIKNIKCNNINNIVIGDNIGNVNVGNKGQVASGAEERNEGDLGANSLGWNGEEGYNGYGKEYNKKDQGFVCINNNNNTINNIEGGNETTPEVPLTCVECLQTFLTDAEVTQILEGTFTNGIEFSLNQVCDLIFTGNTEANVILFLRTVTNQDADRINNIIECLLDAGIVFEIESAGFNAQGERGSLASFGIHNGGTGDLSALEKTTKLKQQWMELLS